MITKKGVFVVDIENKPFNNMRVVWLDICVFNCVCFGAWITHALVIGAVGFFCEVAIKLRERGYLFPIANFYFL